MDKNAVKIGLIGLGAMGQNHLRVLSILKKADVRFIYDANTQRAADLAAQYSVQHIAKIDEAFNQTLDAVIICTPTSTHTSYIKQASNYVKNIFVEKPMAASLAEAEEINQLVFEKKLNLQVGFIERFNPAVQQLKRVLDASRNVISIDFTRTNKLSSRITDVDVISDLMVHDVDLALYLNGPIRDLHAQGSIENNLVNFSSAIITHENGKFSRIQASRITEKKIRRIEATCEDMFVDCELLRKEIIVSRQSEIYQVQDEAYRVSSVQENIEVKPQEALLMELQSFIESCHGKMSDNNADARAGLNAAKVCDLIKNGIYK